MALINDPWYFETTAERQMFSGMIAMCLFCSPKLTRRTFVFSLAGGALVAAASGNLASAAEYTLPESIAGVQIPSSNLSRDAAGLMWVSAPRPLFNHCLRTFVLGMIDARRRNLKIDKEAAFHASILHDLGLTAAYPGNPDLSFEENFGQFAAAFARVSGLSDTRAENVYQAILLHAGKADGQGLDIEFVMHGARQDAIGPTEAEISDEQLRDVEVAVPRLSFRTSFLEVLKDHNTRTRNPSWTNAFYQNPPAKFLENRWSS